MLDSVQSTGLGFKKKKKPTIFVENSNLCCMYIFIFIYHLKAPMIIDSPENSSLTMSRYRGAPGASSEPKLLPKQDTKSICKGNNWQETIRRQQKNPQCREQWRCERAARVIPGTGQQSRAPFSNLAKQIKAVLNCKSNDNQHTSFATPVKSIITSNGMTADASEKYQEQMNLTLVLSLQFSSVKVVEVCQLTLCQVFDLNII